SDIWAKYGHGIRVSSARPSGRIPVRIARRKSASDHWPRPLAVRLVAGGAPRAAWGTRPPLRPEPWQVAQPATRARYAPYSAETLGAGVGRRGSPRSIDAAGISGSCP